jgi:hypothetical protein
MVVLLLLFITESENSYVLPIGKHYQTHGKAWHGIGEKVRAMPRDTS